MTKTEYIEAIKNDKGLGHLGEILYNGLNYVKNEFQYSDVLPYEYLPMLTEALDKPLEHTNENTDNIKNLVKLMIRFTNMGWRVGGHIGINTMYSKVETKLHLTEVKGEEHLYPENPVTDNQRIAKYIKASRIIIPMECLYIDEDNRMNNIMVEGNKIFVHWKTISTGDVAEYYGVKIPQGDINIRIMDDETRVKLYTLDNIIQRAKLIVGYLNDHREMSKRSQYRIIKTKHPTLAMLASAYQETKETTETSQEVDISHINLEEEPESTHQQS